MKQTMFLVFAVAVLPLAAVKTNKDLPFDVLEGADPKANGTQVLEKIVENNLLHDMKEASQVPDMEKNGTNGTNTTNSSEAGLGRLASNLEFLLLKVAQLDTWLQRGVA